MPLLALLAISIFLANMSLGLSVFVDTGTGSSPAWSYVDRYIPRGAIASIFVLIGVLGMLGIWNLKLIRYALWLGSAIFWFWTIVLIMAGLTGGILYPSVLLLAHIGILKFVLAEWVVRIPTLKKLSEAIQDAGR